MNAFLPLTLSWLAGAGLLCTDGCRRSVALLAAALLLAVTALDIWWLLQMLQDPGQVLEFTTGGWPRGIGIHLRIDAPALFFAAVSAGVLTLVMYHEAGTKLESSHFPGLLLLMCAGLHGAFFTSDLFNFYVFFEVSMMSSFALASYGYGRSESRGALIYMVVNLLGSVLFLVGVINVYHTAATLDFDELSLFMERSGHEPLLLAGAHLLVAFSLKLGLFPFHGWVPMVYSHARPTIVAALAGALFNIGAYGLLRIGTDALPGTIDEARWLILLLGGAATLYGAVLALSRRLQAELAAYLAIAHAGYILLGLGLGGQAGMATILLVILSGAMDKTLMFLSLDSNGRRRRITSLVAAVSMAGMPFTLGFITKLQLFQAAAGPTPQIWIIVVLLLSTPLTMAASFRFWWLACDEATTPYNPPMLPLVLLSGASILLGLYPKPVGDLVLALGGYLLENAP